MSDGVAPAAPVAPFLSRRDIVAGLIAGGVAGLGYFWTLAPGVTLEDSGELLTAASTLGVPHPPGYPLWTLVAWLWSHLVPVGNIAWRVNLMSAVLGAAACGLVAMLVSKSGARMARRLGGAAGDGVVLAGAVTAGLLLAFSPVMWSQSVISEVYSLNACVLLVTLWLLYWWSFRKESRWRLYLAALVWGVGLTNHQTLVLLAVALPLYVWLVDPPLGRDALVPILAALILGVLLLMVTPASLFRQGLFSAGVLLLVAVGAGVWLVRLGQQSPGLMQGWRRVAALYGAVILGLTLYLYLPLASSTNPPLNWGYTRTVRGFVHHFCRSQYEPLHTERTVPQLWAQLNFFLADLHEAFHVVWALFALLTILFYRELPRRERDWLRFLLAAFLCLGLGFVFLANPTSAQQQQFTDRVFFLPGHCLYAMWIGYGMILGASFVLRRRPAWARWAAPVVALVPLFSIGRNWADAEQFHHDFGDRFGRLMFAPGGEYPEMARGAVLFGGTDPGRFVPMYLIFVESQVWPRGQIRRGFDRRDVYLLTQDALADDSYLQSLRDQYGPHRPDPERPETVAHRPWWQNVLLRAAWRPLGRHRAYPAEPLWLPSEQDRQRAFEMYAEELRSRPPEPGEDVRRNNGRVELRSLQSVMAVNGILARMIFERNKAQHTFYVEENHVMPWMRPHLEPAGIILKLNPEPAPVLRPEIVARDRRYWDALTADLTAQPRYRRDHLAQQCFAKLRLAIGGVYAFRQMYAEAEYAYRQAIALCPDCADARLRLAQLYVEMDLLNAALAVLEEFKTRDPSNVQNRIAIHALKELQRQAATLKQLENEFAADPTNVATGWQLFQRYAARNRVDAMDSVVNRLSQQAELPAPDLLRFAEVYAGLRQSARTLELLRFCTQRHPANPAGWYNLAVFHALQTNCDLAVRALEQALAHDTPTGQFRNLAKLDARFHSCRNHTDFNDLLNRLPAAPAAPAPFR